MSVAVNVQQGTAYAVSGSGHRAEYLALFARIFGLGSVEGPMSFGLFFSLVRARRLVFATIDDGILSYFGVAVVRACLRRKTVGLFLRPHACFKPGFKAWVKRQAFAVLRRVAPVTTLAIIPFDLRPELAAVTDTWIHDPQLWDEIDAPGQPDQPTRAAIRSAAGDRPVFAFLGAVNRIKGFPFLVEIADAEPSLFDKYHFVIAGVVSPDCTALVAYMAQNGATVWPRRISDEEMAAVYAESTLVWACYDPAYDQASGIFGRAVQRGKTVVIRHGSLLEQYSAKWSSPVLTLSYSPLVDAAKLLVFECQTEVVAEIDPSLRSYSLAKISVCMQ